jgi:hypothetical protein
LTRTWIRSARLTVGNIQVQSNVYRAVAKGDIGQRPWRDCHNDEHDEQDWYSGDGSAYDDADCNNPESTTEENVPPKDG